MAPTVAVSGATAVQYVYRPSECCLDKHEGELPSIVNSTDPVSLW